MNRSGRSRLAAARLLAPVPHRHVVLTIPPAEGRRVQRLLDKRAISDELVGKLLAWRHPGFRKQLIRSPRVRTLLAYGHARN